MTALGLQFLENTARFRGNVGSRAG